MKIREYQTLWSNPITSKRTLHYRACCNLKGFLMCSRCISWKVLWTWLAMDQHDLPELSFAYSHVDLSACQDFLPVTHLTCPFHSLLNVFSKPHQNVSIVWNVGVDILCPAWYMAWCHGGGIIDVGRYHIPQYLCNRLICFGHRGIMFHWCLQNRMEDSEASHDHRG